MKNTVQKSVTLQLKASRQVLAADAALFDAIIACIDAGRDDTAQSLRELQSAVRAAHGKYMDGLATCDAPA